MINNGMIEYLIVDSGGFIKNAPLKDIAENIYTVNEVVNEIRDKSTRQRLQVLPFELNFVNPLSTSLAAVTEFSKKTGDYASLSAIDLKLIALTHQLTLLHDKSIEIQSEPKNQIIWETNRPNDITLNNIPGFYIAPKSKKSESISECLSEKNSNVDNENLSKADSFSDTNINKNKNISISKINKKEIDEKESNIIPENHSNLKIDTNEFDKQISIDIINDFQYDDNIENNSNDEIEEDDDDDDDAGWVTPGNVDQILTDSMKEFKDMALKPIVACLTTDFAMQNVLIQMGLKVVSVDGFLIKRANSYVLRCFSCFKISKDTNRVFCHHCGNMSLQKVAMSIDEDGKISYQNKKLPSARGSRYSLPMPKGGKHSWNPILCEDQLVPQQRLRKKDNHSNLDHIDLECPFTINDVKSRSNKHGFHMRMGQRRNPNDNSQSHQRKK